MKINETTQIGNTGYSLEKLIPYVLYSNDSGSRDDIVTNDNPLTYKRIDIVYGQSLTYGLKTLTFYPGITNTIHLEWSYIENYWGGCYCERPTLTSTGITRGDYFAWEGNNGSITRWWQKNNTSRPYIYEIIGYK